MSLTLNEVRNIKFRMAKRSGYEVLDVDEFVDHVEEGLTQLLEENENLKRQLESLQSGQNGARQNGAGQNGAAQNHDGENRDGQNRDAQNSAERSQAVQASPEPVRPEPQPVAATAVPQAAGRETIVVTTSQEASSAVVRLVQLSTEQSEKLVSEAEDEASRIRDEANRSAHQVTTDARTRAERIESEARVNADRVRSDSQGRAAQLDQDTEARRSELFSGLEQQRDQLTGAVSELRQFESQYRQNLSAHLKQQLEVINGHHGEPEATPALLNGHSAGDQGDDRGATGQTQHESDPAEDGPRGRRAGYGSAETNGGSDTPRLDALLGDH